MDRSGESSRSRPKIRDQNDIAQGGTAYQVEFFAVGRPIKGKHLTGGKVCNLPRHTSRDCLAPDIAHTVVDQEIVQPSSIFSPANWLEDGVPSHWKAINRFAPRFGDN